MKIKEIKLYGFKSFPDETKLALNAGITAFVGPNGSGKSNIFDALRWVFGEQSMKALRCERIEDLIYVSPDTRNDAHFTEVSITIDNENYFPQFGGEFEIKRRFYRSGESEFFLNRVKCRLQDIQALFLNSGTLTYSFLELSEIEKIIHGDTKEMFNDVSGILKYQERREQTRRRLDVTEQDLLRLEDIIHEMQRSLRSLRRQVRQTRLYQELKDEYARLTLYLLKKDYVEASEQLSELQKKISNTDGQRQSVLLQTKKLEQNREYIKREMAKVEVEKKSTLERIGNIDSIIERLQSNVERNEEHAREIVLARERNATRINEKMDLMNNNRQRLVEHENKVQELTRTIESVQGDITNAEGQLKANDDAFFSALGKISSADDTIRNLDDETQQLKQEIARLHFEKENKRALLSKLSREYDTQQQELDAQQRAFRNTEEELKRIVAQQEEVAKRLRDAQEKLGENEQQRAVIDSDLRQRNDAIAECKLLIDTLTHRMREKSSIPEIEQQFKERHRGLFRKSITVEPGYEAIVDICLGDLLDFYLLESFSPQDFTSVPEGRIGFVDVQASIKEEPLSLPRGTQSLSQFVHVKSSFNVLKTHIGRYFIVGDFQTARALSEEHPGCGFVVPEGFLFKDGTVVIERGEVGYFKMRQRLSEKKKELETLRNELLFTQEETERLITVGEGIRNKLEEDRNELFSINVQKSEYSMKMNECKRAIEKLNKDFDSLRNDQNVLQAEEERIDQQITTTTQRMEKMTRERTAAENDREALVEQRRDLKREIDEKNAYVNLKKMELVALEERLSSLTATAQQLRREITGVEEEVRTLGEATHVNDLDETQKEIQRLNGELSSAREERKEIEAQLPEKLIEQHTQSLNDIFDQLSEKQQVLEELQNNIMQYKYTSFQLTHKKDEAARRAQEECKTILADYVPEEEMTDTEQKLTDVRTKMERLGEINPLSLELYETEKKRLDEFLKQRNDIIAAKQRLLDSIEELDTRARDRFTTTFVEVKEQFNYVFSNFFEGGTADLVLTDPANPLTSRVDIVVRMKGKRLKTINQLSGGERTLLAISLLLAFYLVKPAPFCILDEIDAPLDDANVVRFNKFLRDLSQRTQVVIITHNRATMEYTDYLYGLTMETPGQSKIISARLADLEKIGALE